MKLIGRVAYVLSPTCLQNRGSVSVKGAEILGSIKKTILGDHAHISVQLNIYYIAVNTWPVIS